MANGTEEKKVLFKIQLDTGDILVKQANLTREIERGKKELTSIKKTSGEATVEYQKQKAEIVNLQREYRNTSNVLQINQRIAQANKGSYEELLNVTKKMEIELKLMGQASGENTEEFKQLQAQILANREKIIGFADSIKDGRPSVGLYKDAVREMKDELKNARGELLHIANTLGESSPEYTAAAKRAGELNDRLDDINKTIKASSGEGFEALRGQFSLLGDNIKNLDFKGVTAQLNSINETVKGIKFETLTEGLKGAGKSFLEFGKTLLFNPFTSIVAGIGLTVLAVNRYKEQLFGLTDAQKDAMRATDGLIIADEKLRESYNANVKALRDLRIEYDVITGKISEYDAAVLRLENNNRDALAQIAKDTKAKTEDMVGFWSQVRLGIAQSLGIGALEAKKVIDEVGRIQSDARAASKAQQEATTQEQQNELAKRFAQIDADTERLLKANSDRLEKEKDLNKKRVEEERKTAEELLKIQLEINAALVEGDLNRINEEKAAEEERKKIQEDKLASLESDRIKEESVEQAKQDGLARIRAEADKKRIEEAVKTGEILNDVTSAVTSAVAQSLEDGVVNTEKFGKVLASALLSIVEKIALTQIAASTAQSLAQPDSVASFGATGVLRAAVLTALIKAAVSLAKSQIAERGAVIPLAAKGVVLGGKPHSQGGTTISADGVPIAEAERGELLTIVNKKSTGLLQGLSALNQHNGWGVPLMERGGAMGSIPEFQMGGASLVSASPAGVSNSFDIESALIRAFSKIKLAVAVQDIVEKSDALADVQDRATI